MYTYVFIQSNMNKKLCCKGIVKNFWKFMKLFHFSLARDQATSLKENCYNT